MNKAKIIYVIKRLITVSAIAKYTLVIFFIFFSWRVNAGHHMASSKEIRMFGNSRTCVVLGSGSVSFDLILKEAVMTYWKSTEFEFIDQSTFEKRRFDPNYSFIVLLKAVFKKDPGGVSYNYISLVLGGKATKLTNMPELCSLPLSYAEGSESDFEYVIPAIVRFMQKHMLALDEERLIMRLKGLRYYNTSTGFKDKELLFNAEMMATDANSPEKIKKVYPYYVKLITVSEIQDEILASPSNVLFNFHVGPGKDSPSAKCFEMIFDAEGNLYYYNSRKITNDNEDGFNLKDFRHIR
jgi:hypothetical protein